MLWAPKNNDMTKNIGTCLSRSDRVAIIDLTKSQESKITHKQLDDYSNAVCNKLLEIGINKGDSVALHSNNNTQAIIYMYGIMKAGAVCLLMNPNFKDKQYILDITKPKLIVNQSDNYLGELNDFSDNSVEVNETDLAFCMFTSGSTGKPKAVLHTHKNRYWIIEKHKVKHDKPRKFLVATSMHYASALSNIHQQINSENTLVLFDKVDPIKIISSIEKYQITDISAPAAVMNMLLKHENMFERVNLSSVKFVTLGSSIVREATIKKLKSIFRNAYVKIYYGTSELGPNLFAEHPSLPTPDMSVGYAADGIEYRIVDGVLQIKTPSLFYGYVNSNKNLTEDGFYNTNDYFTVDENGFYYCHGRADDCFKSGGNMINPHEIEALLEQFPNVITAVVVPKEDDIKLFKPVCYVSIKDKISIENLKQFALDKLEAYKVPREFYLSEIPLTNNGKIDRTKLKEMANAK